MVFCGFRDFRFWQSGTVTYGPNLPPYRWRVEAIRQTWSLDTAVLSQELAGHMEAQLATDATSKQDAFRDQIASKVQTCMTIIALLGGFPPRNHRPSWCCTRGPEILNRGRGLALSACPKRLLTGGVVRRTHIDEAIVSKLIKVATHLS
jgi:hypothetical protein